MTPSGHEPIQLEEGWEQILAQIEKLEAILDEGINRDTRPFNPADYALIYKKTYDMCTQRTPCNWSEALYTRHGEVIDKYLASNVLPSLREKHDQYLLRELVTRWERHEVMNKWMGKFFMYLDRYYVKHHSLPTLKDAGLHAFKSGVFDIVKPAVSAAMLKLVEKDREGEDIDRELIKNCVKVFQAMEPRNQVYEEDFEHALLEETHSHYQKKAQEWMATDSTSAYLVKAEAAIEAEARRVAEYLVPSTDQKLISACVQRLLEQQETQLLEKEGSGCRALLRDDKKEDLHRMFRLFGKVEGGLLPMANIVRDHITQMGEDIVAQREAVIASEKEKESSSDPTFVNALLALHDRYRMVINDQFEGHALFQKALKEAFEVFINKNAGKYSTAEMMSAYCNRILKNGEKLSDSQIEEGLEKIVLLFSYLTDKDLFGEIYRNALAKRLLGNKSASKDAEKSMIAKLKLRCGAQFTSKMEGMITDLAMSDDNRKEFVAFATEKYGESSSEGVVVGGVDFAVEVLTTGHWPSYTMIEPILPRQLMRCIDVYVEFYNGKHDHRTIKWVHSLGNVSMRAVFKKVYDLNITTVQAVALLCFNGEDGPIDFLALQTRLNLEEDVMKKVLHSLCFGKFRVLKKEPDTKTLASTDRFYVNLAFASQMRKITIPMPSTDESHNPKRVEEDRSIAIEAAIVRIMKSRKRLAHTQLVAEVLAQLQTFKPNPKIVKKRIEHLIDREYLERDEEQSNFYKYLA